MEQALVLRFESPQLRLKVLEGSPEYSEVLDDWLFSEHFSPSTSFSAYHVTMEHTVSDDEDAGSAFISGEYLAQALEKAWLYGTGAIMGGRGYDFMLPPARLPQSWTTNASEVLSESDWTLLRDGASHASSRRTTPTLPLKACIDSIKALATADDITVQLSTYHFGAVTTLDPELHLLLFAQGLEMARELLPGKTKKEKEAALPNVVKARLSRRLDWFFAMSNQRRQTRHAIDKQASPALKEEFNEKDEQDYLAGANLLLQYVVSNRLALPLMLFEDDVTVLAV